MDVTPAGHAGAGGGPAPDVQRLVTVRAHSLTGRVAAGPANPATAVRATQPGQ